MSTSYVENTTQQPAHTECSQHNISTFYFKELFSQHDISYKRAQLHYGCKSMHTVTLTCDL